MYIYEVWNLFVSLVLIMKFGIKKMGRPIGFTVQPKQIGGGGKDIVSRPVWLTTQTDQVGHFSCPICVGPLEMPSVLGSV